MRSFQFLGTVAGQRGTAVSKHTHGEFAIAAAAAHQVMLTLPNIVRRNQQTSAHMGVDLVEIPIQSGPDWGLPTAPGLGITFDQDRLDDAAARYRRDGQYLPYQLDEVRSAWEWFSAGSVGDVRW